MRKLLLACALIAFALGSARGDSEDAGHTWRSFKNAKVGDWVIR